MDKQTIIDWTDIFLVSIGLFVTRDWKAFHEGFELRQIIVCLKETKQESLIQHLASKLIQGLEAGMSLAEQFQNYRFLSEEFSKIVLQERQRKFR